MGNLFNKKNKNKNKAISELTDLNSLSQNNLKSIIGGKKSKNSSSCGGIIPQ